MFLQTEDGLLLIYHEPTTNMRRDFEIHRRILVCFSFTSKKTNTVSDCSVQSLCPWRLVSTSVCGPILFSVQHPGTSGALHVVMPINRVQVWVRKWDAACRLTSCEVAWTKLVYQDLKEQSASSSFFFLTDNLLRWNHVQLFHLTVKLMSPVLWCVSYISNHWRHFVTVSGTPCVKSVACPFKSRC